MNALIETMQPAARAEGPGLSHFRQALFNLLKRYRIHYCVRAGLNLVVDVSDDRKLPALLRDLSRLGYWPIRAFDQGNGSGFVFAWFEGLSLETATVTIAVTGKSWAGQKAWRRFKQWCKPAGLCIILLGPDGVGKSTLIAGLNQALAPLFGPPQLFHWRPGLALPIRDDDDSPAGPHADPPRSAIVSICYLLGFFVDFCLGYALRVRPVLARRGLIIFDRYFPDLMVDRKRYRYSGPAWLVRALWRILPRQNELALILTGSPEAIFLRKQQLPLEELQRQTAGYRALAAILGQPAGRTSAHVIETGAGIEATRTTALRSVVQHLSRRFMERP